MTIRLHLISQAIFHNKNLLVFGIIVSLNIFLWAGVILAQGIIINRDIDFPVISNNFQKRYIPLWNDLTSQANTENLPRLVMMSPFIALLSIGMGVPVILKIILISSFTFVTVSMYALLKAFLKYLKLEHRGNAFFSVIGAFIFAYNPATLQFVGALPIIISIGVLPLLLYLILTKIRSKYFPFFVAGALLLSLGHPFVFVLNCTIAVVFMILIYRNHMKLVMSKLVLSTIVFVLFSAWFWLPYASDPVTSVDLGRINQLQRNIYDIVSRNDIYKIFLLERNQFKYVDTDSYRSTFHYGSLALLVGLSMSCFFINRLKSEKAIFIYLLGGFIGSTLLALGSSGPLGDIYYSYITGSDMGWIFRSPLKFQLYQSFFISLLFIISLVMLKNRFKQYPSAIVCAVSVILIGVLAYGVYDANFNSLNPINLPKQYFEINDILQRYNTNNTFKVLYYPLYDESPTDWSYGHRIGPFDSRSSQIPTYELFTNYNFIKNMLYDYPYTSGLLKSSNYYDFLASLGIRYIIFHNDRIFSNGYALDQHNLDYLLHSQSLNTIYEKNGWYIFELHTNGLHDVGSLRAMSNVAIVGNKNDIYKISEPSIGVFDESSLKSNPDLDRKLNNLDKLNLAENTNLYNKNKSVDHFIMPMPNSNNVWTKLNPKFAVAEHAKGTDKYMVEISTNSTRAEANPWSRVVSNPMNVQNNLKYLTGVYMKTENVYRSNVKLQAYYPLDAEWKDIVFLTSNINGNSSRSFYWQTFSIPPGVTQIRYVINAGPVLNSKAGNAITWIDKFQTYVERNEENSSQVHISYTKSSPFLWRAKVNASSPFILAFTETYDPGWTISSGSDRLKSFPLYGTINGFLINKAGQYDINIEYQPQKWFYYGCIISVITAIGYVSVVSLSGIISHYARSKRSISKT